MEAPTNTLLVMNHIDDILPIINGNLVSQINAPTGSEKVSEFQRL